MPGLIEMHAHLVLLGQGMRYPQWIWVRRKGGDRALEVMRIAAHEFLMNGVTTVRDLGAETKLSVTLRDAINAGKEPGPRLFEPAHLSHATVGMRRCRVTVHKSTHRRKPRRLPGTGSRLVWIGSRRGAWNQRTCGRCVR